MHKCDCKNADCDRFDGTCTCWEDYTGFNCEEKILYITEFGDELNETSIEDLDNLEIPQSHIPNLFKNFVILLGLFVAFSLLSQQGKGSMNQEEPEPVCQMYKPQYMDDRYSVRSNRYNENEAWVVRYENTDPLQNPDFII
jgi:hypothetical protein